MPKPLTSSPFCVFLGFAIGLVFPLCSLAAGPVVSSVRASQRPGTKLVDIWYNVSDAEGDTLDVSAQVEVGGSPILATRFSGHVGTGVTAGNNRHIVWDAGADWDGQYSGAASFLITANDGTEDYLIIDLSAGPSAASYPVSYLSSVPPGGWTDAYKTTKLVMRRIPAGTFTMGSPSNELGRVSSGSWGETQHQVTLTKHFYIGVFEVTQKQWERVMGNWPSWFNNTTYRNSRPVEQVSYNNIRGSSLGSGWPGNNNVDASSFMGRLRARTGFSLDLPTEAQWEYACRAGTATALNSGNNITSISSDARMSEVGRYWYNGGSGYYQSCAPSKGTATVGSYQPNSWGLYDMHGNVYEWCLDYHGAYPAGPVVDPGGAASSNGRILRSGGWFRDASGCRSACRAAYWPDLRNYYDGRVGFRVAGNLP